MEMNEKYEEKRNHITLSIHNKVIIWK